MAILTNWTRQQTLTIANGATDSDEFDLRGTDISPFCIQILSPATLPETVNPQAADVPGSSAYVTLRSNATDIALAAGKGDFIGPILAGAFRLHAGGAVAADRIFKIFAVPYWKLFRP